KISELRVNLYLTLLITRFISSGFWGWVSSSLLFVLPPQVSNRRLDFKKSQNAPLEKG
ncbi:MAG: hypothetical protein ACJARN_000923, partial [Arenicella sp.]